MLHLKPPILISGVSLTKECLNENYLLCPVSSRAGGAWGRLGRSFWSNALLGGPDFRGLPPSVRANNKPSDQTPTAWMKQLHFSLNTLSRQMKDTGSRREDTHIPGHFSYTDKK